MRYTNAQWKCIQRIRNKLDENTPADDETEDRSLINALMCLCMLTVMQDTSRIGLYHSPMMHYLAVRGVDEQSQSLRSAFCYTPIHNDKTNLGSSWFISPYNPLARICREGQVDLVKLIY